MNNNSLRIKFEGNDYIKLKTLKSAIDSAMTCLTEITNKEEYKEAKPDFIVKIEKGSFIIEIAIKTSVVLISNFIAKKVVGLFKTRKHLEGEPPKVVIHQTNNVFITNSNNVTVSIDNEIFEEYKNEKIETKLAQLSRNLATDSTRTTFSVSEVNNENEIIDNVDYGYQDIKNTLKAIDVMSINTTPSANVMQNVKLGIIKCYLDGAGQWEFRILQSGTKISATIKDSKFLGELHADKIKVSKGTTLTVDLECQMKLDRSEMPTGKTIYSILAVKSIEDAPIVRNVSMFDNE